MDNKFKKCRKCNTNTLKHYWSQDGIICEDCIPYVEQMFIDNIEITEAGPILVQPKSAASEEELKAAFIDYIYTLFDLKISPQAFKLMNSYRKKGYTWLGMMRSMEYFYTVKKNDISKAKQSIGIIPHVYDKAQLYYKFLGQDKLEKSLIWWENRNKVDKVKQFEKTDKKKTKEINMNDLI